MHKVAPAIEATIDIPLLHIADACGQAIAAAGIEEIGLLRTAFTMEQDFYRQRLSQRHGIRVHVPAAAERGEVHRVIFEELCRGRVLETSRQAYRSTISQLAATGARGLLLGCTEIGLLISGEDSALPLFDSAELHARMAVDWSLRD